MDDAKKSEKGQNQSTAANTSTDQRPDSRPDKLNYRNTKVIGGRNYIDLSGERESDSVQLKEVHSDLDKAEDAMVTLVAEDLQERIRMASPPQSAESIGHESQASSSSSLPSPYPPLLPDANVLADLETQSAHIAHNVDRMLTELKGTLHGMSALTVQNAETYTVAISKSCDTIDLTIKSTYQLMAKVEELLQQLKAVPRLAQQIKEIRRVLDLFESHLQKSAG